MTESHIAQLAIAVHQFRTEMERLRRHMQTSGHGVDGQFIEMQKQLPGREAELATAIEHYLQEAN